MSAENPFLVESPVAGEPQIVKEPGEERATPLVSPDPLAEPLTEPAPEIVPAVAPAPSVPQKVTARR